MVLRPTAFLLKPTKSKILIYQTDKEFDHCAGLLKNILSVQESRRSFKSPGGTETDCKKPKQYSSLALRKQQNSRGNVNSKASVTRRKISNEVKTIASPVKHESRTNPIISSPKSIQSKELLLKNNRSCPRKYSKDNKDFVLSRENRHEKTQTGSKIKKTRCEIPSVSIDKHVQVRGDSNSNNRVSLDDTRLFKSQILLSDKSTNVLLQKLIRYLTKIQDLSKQIHSYQLDSIHQCSDLWKEFEQTLSNALSFLENNQRIPNSFSSIQDDLLQLRKELRMTNSYTNKKTQASHQNTKYVQQQQQQIHSEITDSRDILLHNEQLKNQCSLLRNQLDQLERTNIRLIQRLTEQDLRSLAERKHSSNNDHRVLLLKEKLYHVYEDLIALFNQDFSLRISSEEQKKKLIRYQQQFDEMKRSAEKLLYEINNHSVEGKIQHFLQHLLQEQSQQKSSVGFVSNQTFHSSPMKSAPLKEDSEPTVFNRSPAISKPMNTQSIASFVKNKKDKKSFKSNAIQSSNFKNHENLFQISETLTTTASSSTIDDADSTLTSSISTFIQVQQGKSSSFHKSHPLFNHPSSTSVSRRMTMNHRHSTYYHYESDHDLEPISDLTSKIFSSKEDVRFIRDHSLSTSTSSFNTYSDPKRIM